MRISTALPGARLRSIQDYCPDTADKPPIQIIGRILGERIEGYDTTISPEELRVKLEESLEKFDPRAYARGLKDKFIPVARLYMLTIVLENLFPPDFMDKLRLCYNFRIRKRVEGELRGKYRN